MNYINTKAPLITEVLKKGRHILDKNLEKILEEVKEQAKIACKLSEGTATKEIACTINKKVQKWELGSQEEMTQKVEDIAYILEKRMADLPENKYLLNKIESMRHEINLTKQFDIICFLIQEIPTTKFVSEHEYNEMIDRLNEVKILIDGLPNKNDAQKFYDKLNALQQPESEKFLFTISSIVTLISSGMQILGHQ